MKRLYCPWREAYSVQVDGTKGDNVAKKDCVFCIESDGCSDADHFILARFKHGYAMLNLYPYNAGSLLIVPYAHQQNLFDLSSAERHELMELVSASAKILKDLLGADAVNIGVNMGKDAGAGIPAHVHIHVLPRWRGDTNFLPLLFDTKHISFDLHKVYEQLKPSFAALTIE